MKSVRHWLALCLVALPLVVNAADSAKPNIVIIMADDLGYGDLGCYGHPTIRTPHLDRMAAEGMRFTEFYSSAPVCTPSRAGLLTGRYPVRSGMASAKRRVLFPNSNGGLPAGEVTIPELLKEQGYATAAIGKWHLGHLPPYLPANHGFDYYFGIPYSNDMDGTKRPPGAAMSMEPKTEWWNVPLMRNNEIIERPARQETITRRYTEESIRFIRENKSRPFFLYLPHTFPHVPLFASTRGRSSRGLYGDVVEELDWSVGQILQTLRDERLDENTLVIFTSDNGPWLIQKAAGGSAGLLRDGKGSTWEGGMRVPAIAWWPGKIKAGQVTRALASNLDFLPTCATLSGAPLLQDVELDGFDLSPVLLGKGDSARGDFIYFRDTIPFAYRKGEYKIHVTTQNGYGDKPVAHDPPLLFHLGHDPSEQLDLAKGHPDLARSLRAELDRHTARIKPGPSQLE